MFCPKCGIANPETSETCGTCGLVLSAAARSLRGESRAPVGAARIAPGASKAHSHTMLGVAMPGAGNQLPPQPPGVGGAPAAARAPSGSPRGPAVSVGGSPRSAPASSHRMGTMLGVPMPAPGSAPTGPPAPATRAGGQAMPGTGPAGPHAPVAGALASGRQGAPQAGVVATVPDRFYPSARTLLSGVLERHGPTARTSPELLEQQFRATFEADMRLLIQAQQAGVPTELSVAANFNGVAACVDGLVHRLSQQYQLSAADARFAVESWAIALGVMAR